MSEELISVDSYDFEEKALKGTVLVYFYEHFNMQSRAFMSVIEELAEEYSDAAVFLSVDVEQSPDIAMRYEIEELPSVLFLNNGEVIELIEGSNPSYVYSDILDAIYDR